MLLSLSLILIVGMSMAWLCQRLRLPGLMGMLATGMILGPHALDLLDADILGISEELRKIALIIILTRAGLGLDLAGLKKTGRPALLMCFVPASFEVLGVILLGTWLMGLTVLEAAVLGSRSCRSLSGSGRTEDGPADGGGIWKKGRDSPDDPCRRIRG